MRLADPYFFFDVFSSLAPFFDFLFLDFYFDFEEFVSSAPLEPFFFDFFDFDDFELVCSVFAFDFEDDLRASAGFSGSIRKSISRAESMRYGYLFLIT